MGKGRDKRKRLARKQKHPELLRPPRAIPESPPPLDDPDAFVFATVKPRPLLGAGSVALPEPDEPIWDE